MPAAIPTSSSSTKIGIRIRRISLLNVLDAIAKDKTIKNLLIVR
jgi:hypothetical protein